MKYSNLLLLFIGSFFSCAIQPQKKVTETSERPNILFIMSDDHAYQAISAYDNTLTSTPNIDRLAEEGMIFNNACVTNSICSPSRAVILTGKHSHINGKTDNHFPFNKDNVTFPQIFQQAGYQTAMFGKLHFGNNPKGFDQFKILIGQGHYYNPTFITKEEGKKDYPGYVTDIVTDMTLDWLDKERDKEKPFMLMYLHKAPHREWLPKEKHYKEFTKKTFKEPETLFDNYEGRATAAHTAEMNILKHMNWAGDSKLYPSTMEALGIPEGSHWDYDAFNKERDRMTPEQREAWDKVYMPMNKEFSKQYASMNEKDLMKWRYQRYMQDYLGTIASVDENVGRVLDYLDENKLADNTLVVYTSDQGFYLGEHGWFDKRFAYNESFKTPLLIRWPNKIKAGITNEEMVQNLDFAQTFLAAAGIEAPSDMQGESLMPLLTGNDAAWDREAVYYHYYEYPSIHMVKRHYAIITKEYKLIHYYYDVDEWELFDRKNDPNELKNVYDDPVYKAVVEKMKKDLAALRVKYKDSSEIDQRLLKKYIESKYANNG
ncbi:sulfatase family protein [Flammeovirga kamogawensis]|uniref:Sulfatase n=1 Tax=Flammeovirga kamogawensis TaxID=373891 RepID=A0ABX8H2W4_9BACT|nr:sulfatase [Flammeovirga kamogawensis]MBB6460453.1 arylsulfatase A-like enzyme [Flammeovirga kamogawensis]QWG10258.1 sulfatase [Flammeovirga kamogawensis]TRX64707.1 sulfatase [Flammeovirga kamogawensis]